MSRSSWYTTKERSPVLTLDELAAICGDRYVAVPFTGEFNFSEKCNLGFLASTGDVVVLLNDDIEVASDGWLEELIGPLVQEADVGMTGARLHFSDMTLQHGGHWYGDGDWTHAFLGAVMDKAALWRPSDVTGRRPARRRRAWLFAVRSSRRLADSARNFPQTSTMSICR